jgi:type II secretory pathway component PulF
MATFRYTARNQAGSVTRGQLEAESSSVAAAQLRQQGLWVTGLDPVGGERASAAARAPRGSLLDSFWTGVSLQEQAVFFRQFGTMVNAGMPLSRALSILGSQTRNRRLREVIDDLAGQAQAGGKLSEAFARHPSIFRRFQVAMVEAAEAGGMLDQILTRLADYLEREHEIRREISRRTLYPKILIVSSIFIPPIKFLIFDGLPAYLRATVGQVLPLLLALFGCGVLGRVLLRNATVRSFYDTVKVSSPFLGSIPRQFAVGKLFRSLSALYGAGLPVGRALRVSADACDNEFIARRVEQETPRVERGEPLSVALGSTRLFTPMVLGMVATGEQSGDMEGMLRKVADYQEQEAEHKTRQAVVFLGVATLLGVATYMAIMIARFWLGYYSGIMAETQ